MSFSNVTLTEKILIYAMGAATDAVFWSLVGYVYDWWKEAKEREDRGRSEAEEG